MEESKYVPEMQYRIVTKVQKNGIEKYSVEQRLNFKSAKQSVIAFNIIVLSGLVISLFYQEYVLACLSVFLMIAVHLILFSYTDLGAEYHNKSQALHYIKDQELKNKVRRFDKLEKKKAAEGNKIVKVYKEEVK